MSVPRDVNWKQALNDRKILEKNASKIMKKLLEGYRFTPEEINDINSRYNKQTEYKKIVDWLRNGSEREKLLADLYFVTEIDNLERANDIMGGNVDRLTEDDIRLMKILGLFE
jgi:hypothetical protein